MVIEHFKNRDAGKVGERFRQNGRMLPDGVAYLASWIDPETLRCFQVMESRDRESLDAWTTCWDDLIDFEIIPVMNSADYWAARQSG